VYGSVRTFTGTEFTRTGTLFNGDTLTSVTLSSVGCPATAAVGSYPILASAAQGNGLSNYVIAYNSGTLTVTAPALPTILSIVPSAGNTNVTVSWTSVSNSVYRVQYRANVASGSWLNLAPDVTALGSTASFIDHPGAAPQRFYRVVLLTSPTPLTPLVVVANDAWRVYGVTNPVFSGTITGVQSNDNITLSYATTAGTGSPVGRYAIMPVLADPNGKLNNYLVSMTNGSLTVTAAVLTVTANNASRVYGAPNPAFNGTISGIQNGDNISATYSSTATVSSPAGTYPIVPSLADPGNKLPNYTVTLNNGTLTVTAPTLPTILSIVPSAGNTNVTVNWTSVSNSVYRVQYRANVASGSWLNLAPDVTAQGSTASFIDHPGAASQRFYRILLLAIAP
jgi:hypothetical protein